VRRASLIALALATVALAAKADAARVIGTPRADRIATQYNGSPDVIRCGRGPDIVTADRGDVVGTDCEVVSVQLSRDPYSSDFAQHETQVEPSSFAVGRTIVSAFQMGRLANGGALGIGFATSGNGGRTWHTGQLPSLTLFSTPAGSFDRASDPVVAYDAAHRVWLIATLGANLNEETEVAVSRSRGGISWSRPISVTGRIVGDFDKEWIACDNSRRSRFRGRCYVAFMDFSTNQILTSRSTDGGLHWSAPVRVSVASPLMALVNGVQPVVRPDGALVMPFAVFSGLEAVGSNEISSLRSADGGLTFRGPTKVADLAELDVPGMRSAPLPSAAVGGDGTVYVAWADCSFYSACDVSGIALVRSRDGISWSEKEVIPTGGSRTIDRFLPALAAQGPRLALTYYTIPHPVGCDYSCRGLVDAWFVGSADNKAWSRPQRLTTRSMRYSWIPSGGTGRMIGDYVGTSFVAGRPMPIVPIASPPVGGRYRQAIFATTRLPR
jgi:hypothetical protein